ncbi:hypothetical protein ABIA33_006886 [Streptacidiphilus sp. MAP12-16]|uniref:hypothetical protein n=1 Tax=Streptacidiphilus sp. MAP12-16 TaxID=3156300 RepID=UPI0035155DC7
MSPTPDRSAALRNRNAGQELAEVSSTGAPSGRPADLVVTSEMVPTPAMTGASGPLSQVEQHELGLCERAVENMATAAWLAGEALQTIRDAKLYRHTHTRFEDYIEERWEIGERTAYQLIEEWALAERLNQVLGKPATASHTRALHPSPLASGWTRPPTSTSNCAFAPRRRASGSLLPSPDRSSGPVSGPPASKLNRLPFRMRPANCWPPRRSPWPAAPTQVQLSLPNRAASYCSLLPSAIAACEISQEVTKR